MRRSNLDKVIEIEGSIKKCEAFFKPSSEAFELPQDFDRNKALKERIFSFFTPDQIVEALGVWQVSLEKRMEEL